MLSHYRIFISELKKITFFFSHSDLLLWALENGYCQSCLDTQGVQGTGEISRQFCGLTLHLASKHFVEHLTGAHLLSCRTCKSTLCFQAGAIAFLWKFLSLPLKMYWKNVMIKTAIFEVHRFESQIYHLLAMWPWEFTNFSVPFLSSLK